MTVPPADHSLLAFIHRWQGSRLSERSAAQPHFIDLCATLGVPSPTDTDRQGDTYTFERGVAKSSGGRGFADVWKRGYFAWEYKQGHADLAAAYRQLLNYQEDLQNPPLLVVCDTDRFEVHTRFTNVVTQVYAFTLADLASAEPVAGTALSALDVLRAVFTAPDRLRPRETTAQVTEAAAREFARLAMSLHAAGADPEQAAHFLMRLLFCLFAQDIQLLPAGLFSRLVAGTRGNPTVFAGQLRALFATMATGGYFGVEDIAHFDGGLFADDRVLDLGRDDLEVLARAGRLSWASVEPAIFGTLFERSLDPAKRAQLGAHYTSRDDILLIIEPVLMAPLRREWAAVQEQARAIIARRDAATTPRTRENQRDALRQLLLGVSTRLAGVRVLDPACGSGNFLYVALKQLMDLEKAVITFAAASGLTTWFPQVKPEQLYGIELNPYAHELAQIVVWIGYLQWLHDNGFATRSGTILRPLDNIREQDAILATDAAGRLVEPAWPEAEVIVGNPPFLGGKRLRTVLGDAYVDALFALYEERVPREADPVTYWFERTWALVTAGRVKRAGLLATQSIRAGANRQVLERIKHSGDIFMAWSDRPWVLEGAAVRVSMIGFDDGSEPVRMLNGAPVVTINADLSAALDFTAAQRLSENANIVYMADTKGGAFDIPGDVAEWMLNAPLNPNSRPNSDVVKPWVNGLDITRRPRGMYIIDFGIGMAEMQASLYETPFAYVQKYVKPERDKNNRASYRERWWIHVEPRPALRIALKPLRRYIATVAVAKHRLFAWLDSSVLPDHRLFVFARDDDYFFGVLHSRVHELWSLKHCSWHGVGNDPTYNATTCFETFPFPWPPGQELAADPRVQAITQAVQELVQKRDAWLNPPAASEAELKRRTLTNLYNVRPTWLDLAHRTLDRAVLDAYGWPHGLSDEDILARLLALNLERAVKQGAAPLLTSQDAEAE